LEFYLALACEAEQKAEEVVLVAQMAQESVQTVWELVVLVPLVA
jgi:hypothetical protein